MFQHSRLYWFLHARIKGIQQGKREQSPTLRRDRFGDASDDLARDTFKRNIVTFVEMARGRNISVILASQPLQPERAG